MDQDELTNPFDHHSAGAPMGRGRSLAIVALVIVTSCGVWVGVRLTSREKAPETHGLKLLNTVVHLPAASFKALDVLLPCAGTLLLEIAAGVTVHGLAGGDKKRASKTDVRSGGIQVEGGDG